MQFDAQRSLPHVSFSVLMPYSHFVVTANANVPCFDCFFVTGRESCV
jgi:hypothetical protein